MRTHLDDKMVYHSQLQVDAVVSCMKRCEDQIQGHEELMSRVHSVDNKNTALEKKQKSLEERLEVEEMKGHSKFERLVGLNATNCKKSFQAYSKSYHT